MNRVRNRATLFALPALLLTSLGYACDHAGDHWKEADTDKDGKISRAEAEAASPRMAQGFARVDKDNDGQLTTEEMQAARTEWREQRSDWREHRDELRDKFNAADKDGDQALNLAEAQAAFPKIAENFGTLDTNNDGKVTPEELRAPRHRM
jgi:Ca2+-binding EF-hand superfamily protein